MVKCLNLLDLVSHGFKEKYKLKSGSSILSISKATIDNSKIIMAQNVMPEILDNSQLQTHLPFVGDKIVLAIKVDANNTETKSSADKIGNKLFGTSGDKVTVKSQLSECSMNQLNMIPFNGTTPSGEVIINGVGNVFLPFALKSKYDQSRENDITNAIVSKYGNLADLVDHLPLVLPKGASNFIVYARVNGYISVYNEKFIHYPSIVMHEIAHNFGFHHSSEGDEEYGDETRVLGYGNQLDNDKK